MSDSDEMAAPGRFSTTQWTQVIHAAQTGQEEVAKKALEAFCQQYRGAIYSFIRRRGYDHQEAEDLVHEFIYVKILKDWDQKNTFVHKARRKTGLFRCFLSNTIIWFLGDVKDRKNRIKRGAGAHHESVEALTEGGIEVSKAAEQDGSCEFDITYALNVLDRACANLRHCKQNLELLLGNKTQDQVADELSMTLGAVKKMHFEFRRKLRAAIRAEVRRTVGPDESKIREELRYLMSLFAKKL
jgi:DNA-directed RNA polymerase specialized sigma24 family protein